MLIQRRAGIIMELTGLFKATAGSTVMDHGYYFDSLQPNQMLIDPGSVLQYPLESE